MTEDWQAGGFGLYIHWPFCESKCPYCDFNSHVAARIDQSRWRRAYLSEIRRIGAALPGRVLRSVFFGGGTPSLMAPETVAEILTLVQDTWPVANDFEVTLEANPGSVEAGRFAAYRAAGVNRVSIGVQALKDADLKRLGRLHSVAEARAAVDIAQRVFDRMSFDLIYARQGQTLQDWRAELGAALGIAAGHLSLYQLTIEPGTAFGDRYKVGKLRGLPDEDLAADLYEVTQEICSAAGLEAYEVSNHAQSGHESRHNLIYWRYGDYAGIGPGAHGRITTEGRRMATTTPLAPERWLRMVETGSGALPAEDLAPRDQAAEYLMMSLRLTEGSDLERYARLAGAALDEATLTRLEAQGSVVRDGPVLRTTLAGRMVLNAVLAQLLP